MKITICSKDEYDEMIAPKIDAGTALISFFDPKYDTEPVRTVPERHFRVKIPDFAHDEIVELGLTPEKYFPEAIPLAAFIKSAVGDGMQIVCQCEFGQGRSAACAAAICEYYEKNGIEIFADYRYHPNQVVFNTLLKALKEVK